MVRDLHQKLTALLNPNIAPALPAMDARPKLADQDDAASLVAPPRAKQTCYFCATTYDIGDPAGNLFVHYPQAEYRYWGHCLTGAHQVILRTLARNTTQLLAALPGALAAGKQYQHDNRDPTRRALVKLLA